MDKKTIVMIGNTSWGMWKFRLDLMKSLLERNYDVLVIAPQDAWSSQITETGCRFYSLHVDRKGTNPINDLNYTVKLLSVFLKEKPFIVLNYTIKPVLYGSIAAWFARVPHRVAITTGLGYIFSKDSFVTRFTKVLYRYCLKFSTQVWFLNQDDLKTFVDTNLVSKEKAFILPGEGVDVDYFKPETKQSREVIFTLISRMLWDKGVGLFAQCAEELKTLHPELKFQIVGPIDEGNPEGIHLNVLNEWNQKGFVHYLGSTDDIRSILKNTYCLVHPTYYNEGLPRVLMEANAMAIPCITTNIPGCKDVITNKENGLLIKPNDKEALKEAIQQFLNFDQKTIERMGASGRKMIVEKFSSERISNIYIERLHL